MATVPELLEALGLRQQQSLARLAEMERELRELELGRDAFSARSIEELPGKKIPWSAMIDIVSPATTAERTGSYTHSQTGLFAITSLAAAYRETSQAKYRPIGSWRDLASPPVVNAIDFLWRIRTSGNDLYWQSDQVPSPWLFSSQERPGYLAVPAPVPPNSTVTVVVNPLAAPAAAGTLRFCLEGFLVAMPPEWKQ